MVYIISKFFLSFTVVISAASSGYLDLEELQSSFYSLKILETPISVIQTEDLAIDRETVQVSSKFGQRYLCHYRKTATSQSFVSDDRIAELNITEILEPMRENCITKTKDWWTYKFCYGEQITQFHLHEGQVSGEIITLGKYESDKTWLPEDLEKLKKSTVNRYHTQSYVNGTICDLTNQPRKAEVRFSCVEGEVDRIGAVVELKPCSYIIFVYTSKICHHPYLQSLSQSATFPIECQPIVSQDAYNDYLKRLQDETVDEDTGTKQVDEVEMDPFDSLLKSFGHDIDETQVHFVGGEDDFVAKLEEQKQTLLELLQETMRENTGKDAVSTYKETIKKYVSSQFDDIIAEAKSELGVDEEGTIDSEDVEKLKGVMSSVLESQLDGLEELEEITKDLVENKDLFDKKMEDVSEEVEVSEEHVSKDKAQTTDIPKTPRKDTHFSQSNYDTGIIDIDDLEEKSRIYKTVEQAKKQYVNSENKQRTVIAIVRPTQEKGTRSEKRRK
ncbi:protein OS-9-like [Watersipora subatra]|uniref:protein OS-9-like n=1 Tax=Watersipora subatra TaxID=2589382 RepID=UPI00355C6557